MPEGEAKHSLPWDQGNPAELIFSSCGGISKAPIWNCSLGWHPRLTLIGYYEEIPHDLLTTPSAGWLLRMVYHSVSVWGVQHTSVSGFSNRIGHSITSWRMCFPESWVIRLPSPPSSWNVAEPLEGIPSKLFSQALSLAECGWHPSLEAGLRNSTSLHLEVTVREGVH